MGFFTNITISNDFWHEISAEPERFVDAITVGMNSGINGPIHEALLEKTGTHNIRVHHDYVRKLTPQGLTVHQATHADVPQVICSTYGRHPIAAHEIPYAISEGWLDGGKYREDNALAVAKELDALAREIRKAVKEAKSDG